MLKQSNHVGVMGGTTAPQRLWLVANPVLAAEVSEDCAADGVDPDDLSAHYEIEGPAALPADAGSLTEKKVAIRWGVSVDTFDRWLIDRGLPPLNGKEPRCTKQHTDVYTLGERYLQSKRQRGAGWVAQAALVDLFAERADDSAVAHTTNFRRSPRAAWWALLASLLQSWDRSGQIEHRSNPESGRKEVRWVEKVGVAA